MISREFQFLKELKKKKRNKKQMWFMMPPLASKLIYIYMEMENYFQICNRILTRTSSSLPWERHYEVSAIILVISE